MITIGVMTPFGLTFGSGWNPADKTTNFSVSDGNRTAAANTSTFETIRAIKFFSSGGGGKWYWKLRINAMDTVGDLFYGLLRLDQVIESGTLFTNNDHMYVQANNPSCSWHSLGEWGSAANSFGSDQRAPCDINLAFDVPNANLYVGKNDIWVIPNNPSAGTGATFNNNYTLTKSYAPFVATAAAAGAVSVTLISDRSSLIPTCPTGYTPGFPL